MKLSYLRSPELAKAFAIAVQAHEGQKRLDGQDYIVHPMRVVGLVDSIQEKIVAALHDVVEDTDVTLDDLYNAGFDEDVVEAVDALSRRDGETYKAFIQRIALAGELAVTVKIADIRDNISDQSALKADQAAFLKKRYLKALEILGAES